MIVALPGFFPVTRPVASTSATDSSLLKYHSVPDAEPDGTVAIICVVPPSAPSVALVALSVTFVGALRTVTLVIAYFPFTVQTTMFAVPAFTP